MKTNNNRKHIALVALTATLSIGSAYAGCRESAADAAQRTAEANRIPAVPSLLSRCGIGGLGGLSGLAGGIMDGFQDFLAGAACGAVAGVIDPVVDGANEYIESFDDATFGAFNDGVDDLNDNVMDDDRLPYGTKSPVNRNDDDTIWKDVYGDFLRLENQ